MAHFAKVEDGIVTQVIVAEQDFIDTLDGTWVQTSYNTRGGVHYGQDGEPDGGVALRKNYAGVGDVYDATRDAFYRPQPFPSWTLDESTCFWSSPLPQPSLTVSGATANSRYEWQEDVYQADNTQGWVLVAIE